jgi:pseudouridine-5'-phosphate glycosidase
MKYPMNLNQHLKLSPKVEAALKEGRPVIALESTIISHGMPYPQNVETALRCEAAARECGAEPATIAVIGGKLCAGLTEEEIDKTAFDFFSLTDIDPKVMVGLFTDNRFHG